MGVVNGVAKPAKQVETIVYREISLLAIIEKQLTFDVLHHDVRPSIRRRSAIKKRRDVRML